MEKKFIVTPDQLKRNDDGSFSIIGELQPYVPSEYLAIGPMDGRYKEAGEKFSPYFSEYALVANRVKVECLWLKFMLENLRGESDILSDISLDNIPKIMDVYQNFSSEDFFHVKEIEAVTNHDVKSAELFVAEKMKEAGLASLVSYVHIGCTSEDITNPAYARMIRDALDKVWIPKAQEFIDTLESFSAKYKSTPMLAHTHGQPATPTTVGKELMVYVYRLRRALDSIKSKGTYAKFNGATGNYAAISVAFPERNWPELAQAFVKDYLGLEFNPITTQIESHDYIVEIGAAICHFNRILSNFCSDMWTYISMEYFAQMVVKTEVGSSTMPNKVNPINFENGEMNLRKSTSDFEFLSEWLMSSRMQRDLRDSTALRNLGPAFAHSYLGIDRTLKGLKKVSANEIVLKNALESKWEVLSEAIQTLLRKYGKPDAYNLLKELTRGKNISQEALQEFMNSSALDIISEKDREKLLAMKPEDYTGLAEQLVDDYI